MNGKNKETRRPVRHTRRLDKQFNTPTKSPLHHDHRCEPSAQKRRTFA